MAKKKLKEDENRMENAIVYRHVDDNSVFGIAFTQSAVDGFEKVFKRSCFKRELITKTAAEFKSLFRSMHEAIIEEAYFESYSCKNTPSQRMKEVQVYLPYRVIEYVKDQVSTGYILERIPRWIPAKIFKPEGYEALKELKYPEMAAYISGVTPEGEFQEPGRVETLDGVNGVHFDELLVTLHTQT